MDRKRFIKTTGLGIGVALIPGAAISNNFLNEQTLTDNLEYKIITYNLIF